MCIYFSLLLRAEEFVQKPCQIWCKKVFPKFSVQSYLVLMYLFPFLYEILKLKGELKLINVLNLLDPINNGERVDFACTPSFSCCNFKKYKKQTRNCFFDFQYQEILHTLGKFQCHTSFTSNFTDQYLKGVFKIANFNNIQTSWESQF